MKIISFDVEKDSRISCFSILTKMTIEDYLSFIEKSFKNKGGIEEQREPLKTSTAVRIRKRMIDDIAKGTVLPPLVIGTIIPDVDFISIEGMSQSTFEKYLSNIPSSNYLLLDGMQRTAALFESKSVSSIDKYNVRVDFWLSTTINSLIYRMLVLNSGQVPWNLRRQIEVIFREMIKDIEAKVTDISIIHIGDNKRRTQAGQYHASDIIELYLVFGSRKERIDTKERLADEFTRLDFIEATEESGSTNIFYEILSYLGKFDKLFSTYSDSNTDNRFSEGKDIFTSQPARVGFVSALSKKILGRPGADRSKLDQEKQWQTLKGEMDARLKLLESMTSKDIQEYLLLDILEENLSIKSSKIGDFEREYFSKAFETLIDEKFMATNLEVCWRAF